MSHARIWWWQIGKLLVHGLALWMHRLRLRVISLRTVCYRLQTMKAVGQPPLWFSCERSSQTPSRAPCPMRLRAHLHRRDAAVGILSRGLVASLTSFGGRLLVSFGRKRRGP
jgi:hypothetical protein